MDPSLDPRSSTESRPQTREAKAIVVVLAAVLAFLCVQTILSRRLQEPLTIERAEGRRLDFKVDPNAATLVELVHLPGVGPALAERIIEDRRRNGPFRTPRDLLRVRGVGPKLLEQIEPYLARPESKGTPPK